MTVKHVAASVQNNRNHGQLDLRDGQMPSERSKVKSIVPALRKDGFALLPGFAWWLDKLSPSIDNNCEAWEALHDARVAEILHSNQYQRRHYFLNDFGKVDSSHSSIEFEIKPYKTHLTFVEDSEEIINDAYLPLPVKVFLGKIATLTSYTRKYFGDILPKLSLQTSLTVRIFDYHASEDLQSEAMRPHTDGSVCTLVMSNTDGLLHIKHGGIWDAIVGNDAQPFAALLPGLAAAHDLELPPTPHKVLPSLDRRVSMSIFLTPNLPANKEAAENQLTHWTLSPPDNSEIVQ